MLKHLHSFTTDKNTKISTKYHISKSISFLSLWHLFKWGNLSNQIKAQLSRVGRTASIFTTVSNYPFNIPHHRHRRSSFEPFFLCGYSSSQQLNDPLALWPNSTEILPRPRLTATTFHASSRIIAVNYFLRFFSYGWTEDHQHCIHLQSIRMPPELIQWRSFRSSWGAHLRWWSTVCLKSEFGEWSEYFFRLF